MTIISFDLADEARIIRFFVPGDKLGGCEKLCVEGGQAEWHAAGVQLSVELPPMSPGLVVIKPE
jgi:hypothetical protein